MVVPLLSGDEVQGAMAVWRTGGSPFEPHELEFLVGLSLQAAVALQNARLFNETSEALERQTASAEVLQVISGSMADPKPVFDKILDSCARLFGAGDPAVCLVDGDLLRIGAYRGKFTEEVEQAFPRPLAGTISDIAIRQGSVLYRPSVLAAHDMPDYIMEVARRRGDFSVVNGPMTWNGRGIGTIDIICTPPRLFSDSELALVKTFADQAVIAIQNARLFNETQEALERQTATADVLKVISESPTDVQPVFEAIAERARTLCDAKVSGVTRFDGEWVHLVAYRGASRESEDAMRSVFPVQANGTTLTGRAIRERMPVQISDVLAESSYGPKDAARLAGFRANLAVPMMREGHVIGAISVCRAEAGPFPDKQVQLLETFADQAVIAIENVRLFKETKDALANQTATADILRVISGSPTSVQPVFDAIVGTAVRLLACDLTVVVLRKGNMQSMVAGATRDGSPIGISPGDVAIDPADNFPARVFATGRLLHVPDWTAVALPERERRIRAASGMTASLMVPMVREGECIGVLVFGRATPGPFRDAEIALAESFADQALIAIENTRLFNETKEALEQQTATAEVLQVISSSVSDTAPVFDKILESCAHLFATEQLGIFLARDDGLVHTAAWRGSALEAVARTFPKPLAETMTARVIEERRAIQIPDTSAVRELPAAPRSVVDLVGHCSIVWAPMLWEGRGIGSIVALRQPPKPFTDKELGLLKTFGDQAVIAIQNARLFNETKEALERQTATAEILRVISGSVTDTQPVFDAIVESCQRLFAGKAVALVFPNGQLLESVAYSDDSGARRGPGMLKPWPLDGGSGAGTCILESRVVNVADTAEGAKKFARMQDLAIALGYKSCLFVPLLRDGRAIGCITILRATLGRFDEQEVALAQTFADQAVIAIQNARLFNETKEALERQTATVRGPARDQRVADRRAAGARRGGGARRRSVPRGRQPRLAGRGRQTARHDELRTRLRRGTRDRRRFRCAGRRSAAARSWSAGTSTSRTCCRSSTPSTRTSARSSSATASARC